MSSAADLTPGPRSDSGKHAIIDRRLNDHDERLKTVEGKVSETRRSVLVHTETMKRISEVFAERMTGFEALFRAKTSQNNALLMALLTAVIGSAVALFFTRR